MVEITFTLKVVTDEISGGFDTLKDALQTCLEAGIYAATSSVAASELSKVEYLTVESPVRSV